MVGHKKIKRICGNYGLYAKTDEDKLLRRKVFDSKRFLVNCESFNSTLPFELDTFDWFMDYIKFAFNNN